MLEPPTFGTLTALRTIIQFAAICRVDAHSQPPCIQQLFLQKDILLHLSTSLLLGKRCVKILGLFIAHHAQSAQLLFSDDNLCT
jgi:hypothetical protein